MDKVISQELAQKAINALALVDELAHNNILIENGYGIHQMIRSILQEAKR